MENIKEILLEEHKSSSDKITLSSKSSNESNNYFHLKCFKSMDEIITIEAKKQNIIKIHKSLFLNLLNLQSIDLLNNHIYKISKSFSNLKNLKTLKLDFNNISFLPNFIGEMEKLEILTITNNKLNRLPSSIQNLQNLKVLKVSNNEIDMLPIEFGLLKSIEILHIDANYFTEIPTTLCYLKHLSELSFEWLEFLDPPFQKVIKENIGKTIITLIRNSLQEMIKQNFLFCDFITFLEKNSNNTSRKESNNSFSNKKPSDNKLNVDSIDLNNNNNSSKDLNSEAVIDGENVRNINSIKGRKFEGATGEANLHSFSNLRNMKIFYAIDNNYYGVIKAMLNSKADFTQLKNMDSKSPLYFAIHNNKIEIISLILSKIDLSIISNSYIYLHKAIRIRDPALTLKLIDLGVDPNQPDDQGTTCFHVLFSSFTKNQAKCALIGDILLKHVSKLNALNDDFWAPIHIAARRASRECLLWILNANKNLIKEGKETFDLNLIGKNKWTPLHLAVNGFRYEETIILLEACCNVFAKNADNKTPRKVANGNCVLSKILRNFEEEYFQKNYFNLILKENINKNMLENHNFIESINNNFKNKNASSNNIIKTLEEYTNLEDIMSPTRPNKLKDNNEINNYFENKKNEEKKDSEKTHKHNNSMSNNKLNKNAENIFNTSMNEINNSNFLIKNINNLIVAKDGIENRRKDFNENNHISLKDYSKKLGIINNLAANEKNDFNFNNKNISSNNKPVQVKLLQETIEKVNKIMLPQTIDFRHSIDLDSQPYLKMQNNSDKNILLNVHNEKANIQIQPVKEKSFANKNTIKINSKSLNVKSDFCFNNSKSDKENLTVGNTNLNNTSVNNACEVSNFNSSLNVIDPLPNNPNINSMNVNNINYLNNMKGIDALNINNIIIRKKNHNLLNENRCNNNDIPLFKKSLVVINNPEIQTRKINLYFHKEIIFNSENNLSEKLESLMHIKFSFASIKYEKGEIVNIIKLILENLDFEFEENYLIIYEITYWILSNRIYNLVSILESLVERINLYRNKSDFLLETLEREILNVLFIMKKTEASVKNLQSIYYNYNSEKQIKNIKIPPNSGETLTNIDLFNNNDLLNSMIKNRENHTITNYSISSQPQNESMTNIKESIKISNKNATFLRNNINFNPANYATNFTNKEKINKSIFENSPNRSENKNSLKDCDDAYKSIFNNAYTENKFCNSIEDVNKFIVFNSVNFGEEAEEENAYTENENFDFINKIHNDNNLNNLNYIKSEDYYNPAEEKSDMKVTSQENELNYTHNELQQKQKKTSQKDLNNLKTSENQDNNSEYMFNIETIRKKFFVEEEKLKGIIEHKDKNENVEIDIKKFNIGSPELSHNMFDNILITMNVSKSKRKFRIVNNGIVNSINNKNKNSDKGFYHNNVNKNQDLNNFFNNNYNNEPNNAKNLIQNKPLFNSNNNLNFFNNKSIKKENPFTNTFTNKFQINVSNKKNSKNISTAYAEKGSAADTNKNNKIKLNALSASNKPKPNIINVNNALGNNNTSNIPNLKSSNSRNNSKNKVKPEKRKDSKGKLVLNSLNLNLENIKKFDLNDKMSKSKQSFTFTKEDKTSLLGLRKSDNLSNNNNQANEDKNSNSNYENSFSANSKKLSYSKSINNFYVKSANLKIDINQNNTNKSINKNKNNNTNYNQNYEISSNHQKNNFNLQTEDSIETSKNHNKMKTSENYTSIESNNSKKPVKYSKEYRSNELIKNKFEEIETNKRNISNKDVKNNTNDFYLNSQENKSEAGSHREIESCINRKEKLNAIEITNKNEKLYLNSNDISNIINNQNPGDTLNCSDKSFLLNENLNNTSSFRIKCVKNIREIKNANSYFNNLKSNNICCYNYDKIFDEKKLLDKTDLFDLTELDSKNSNKDKTLEKNIEFLKLQNLENRKKSIELIKKNYDKITSNFNINKESNDRSKIPRHEINSISNDFISPKAFNKKEKIDSSRIKYKINLSSKKPINSSDYYSHQEKSRITNSFNKFNENDNESCNLVDSFRSIFKNEEHLESKNSTFTAIAKNEFLFRNNNVMLFQNEYFTSVAPKKLDSSLFDFEI